MLDGGAWIFVQILTKELEEDCKYPTHGKKTELYISKSFLIFPTRKSCFNEFFPKKRTALFMLFTLCRECIIIMLAAKSFGLPQIPKINLSPGGKQFCI